MVLYNFWSQTGEIASFSHSNSAYFLDFREQDEVIGQFRLQKSKIQTIPHMQSGVLMKETSLGPKAEPRIQNRRLSYFPFVTSDGTGDTAEFTD